MSPVLRLHLLSIYYLSIMEVDVLIVGQGIAGTMLSWFLHKEGKTFVVIDENRENTSSKVAAGIINPVTGRRFVYTWMIDEIMPFAIRAYSEIEKGLDRQIVYPRKVIDFFPTVQMRDAFLDRIAENDTYLHSYPFQNQFNDLFNYDFGCGEISPSYQVDLQFLLSDWRKKLEQMGVLNTEQFLPPDIVVKEESVQYRGIKASRVVFCDGVSSFNNEWFGLLPFSFNKGEALIIECEGLPSEFIYKKTMAIAPLPNECFWVGSNYQWDYENTDPTDQFYKRTKEHLSNWLKMPFKILDHKASVRPATIERRPFVGFHPSYPTIGILNGLGSKGTALAPYFAHQLVQNIVYNLPITSEADVHRFNRILSK